MGGNEFRGAAIDRKGAEGLAAGVDFEGGLDAGGGGEVVDRSPDKVEPAGGQGAAGGGKIVRAVDVDRGDRRESGVVGALELKRYIIEVAIGVADFGGDIEGLAGGDGAGAQANDLRAGGASGGT